MYLPLLLLLLLVILLVYVLHAKKSEPLNPSINKEAAETIIEKIEHPEIPKPGPILKNKWLHVSDEFGVMQPGISEPYYPDKKKKQEGIA
jgi:hypothetical protein